MKCKFATDANRVFLFSVIVSQLMIYVIAGFGVNDIMVLQFLIQVFLALPAVLYLLGRQQPVTKSLGLTIPGIKEWLLLIPLAVCVDKIAEFINVVSQLFTRNEVSNHMIPLILQYPFPVALFVIAVTPAICEELVYRGVLFHNYRKTGLGIAVVLSGFLFGIMHMNLNQFSYGFVLGILLALVNEITGSVLPSVFLHLYINGRSVVMVHVIINQLRGLRERYVAAESAQDTAGMEQLRELAGEIPIHSEQWLEEYLNMESGNVGEMIVSLLPGFFTALLCACVIFRFLLKIKKKKDAWGNGTSEIQNEKETRGRWSRVLSPELFIGIGFCIVFMLIR